ncbi:MAG: 30S ribosome-binding factor RbfA [Micavibrio aeruginosavorus]|uniref:Ribosome-binding factor A n=1 Tax=Micavibrio aeruginosavorus TaxID=349221 RepID=A0A7T5R0Y7_9BACT|nr:MAG: 30S ribosome-binding factor RbfA [Micavibrio aeruginosavorus]
MTTTPSQRQLRVGEQLRHIIAQTLQRGKFSDPLLFDKTGQITVAEVRVSPDMKHATAYTSMITGQDIDLVLAALNETAHMFQQDINRQIKMKFTPKVRFVVDDRFDKAGRIEDILRNLPKSSAE